MKEREGRGMRKEWWEVCVGGGERERRKGKEERGAEGERLKRTVGGQDPGRKLWAMLAYWIQRPFKVWLNSIKLLV